MSNPAILMAVRMKRLPRQHRVAHLRALIRRASAGSMRRHELDVLLRDELTARAAKEGRRP